MECFTPYVNKLILQIILLRKMCFLHLKSDSSGTLNAHLNLKLKLQCIVPENAIPTLRRSWEIPMGRGVSAAKME